MKKTTTVILSGIAVLLTFSMVLFTSCEKEKLSPYRISVRNYLDFTLKVKIDNWDSDKDYSTLSSQHFSIYTSKDAAKPMNIRVYNLSTGKEVGSISFQGKPGKLYNWDAGSGNPVKDQSGNIVSGGGNNGGNNGGGGGCPGAQAQHYIDLMDNNSTNDCQQIWAQQAAWHAYKCNCDEGLANASDAKKMVAVLNSIRKNIQDLYKSGGNANSTKCGATPPTVSKCNVK